MTETEFRQKLAQYQTLRRSCCGSKRKLARLAKLRRELQASCSKPIKWSIVA